MHRSRSRDKVARPSLRLVAVPPATSRRTREGTDEQAYELKLSLGQLALVYKSLQAVKTLGALPRNDEVLNDTIRLVDQALEKYI